MKHLRIVAAFALFCAFVVVTLYASAILPLPEAQGIL